MRSSQIEMFKGGEVLGNGSSLSMDTAIIMPERDVLVNQPSLFSEMPSWAWIGVKVRASRRRDAADWLMKSWEDPRQLEL